MKIAAIVFVIVPVCVLGAGLRSPSTKEIARCNTLAEIFEGAAIDDVGGQSPQQAFRLIHDNIRRQAPNPHDPHYASDGLIRHIINSVYFEGAVDGVPADQVGEEVNEDCIQNAMRSNWKPLTKENTPKLGTPPPVQQYSFSVAPPGTPP